MPINFQCPECGQSYRLGDQLAGQHALCKSCGAAITVPEAVSAEVSEVEDGPTVLDFADVVEEPGVPAPVRSDNPYQAPRASPPTSRAPQAGGDDTVATVIPYKNSSALIAYYLGVFSIALWCIPLVGWGMTIAAIVLGIKGLRYVKRYPEAHGTAHAWVGIILGSITTLLWLGSLAFFVFAMVASAH